MGSGETGDSVDPRQNNWDEFIRRVNELVESGTLSDEEVDYKLELGCEFAKARKSVQGNADDWADRLKEGLANREGHPLTFFMRDDLRKWVDQSPDDALGALSALWKRGSTTVSERIRAFCFQLPESVTKGAGTRMSLISTLLMGLDATLYPPFGTRTFEWAYSQTGYNSPRRNTDESELYEEALEFLDHFLEEARARGANLHHRLEMQSVVWHWKQLNYDLPHLRIFSQPRRSGDLEELADELLLSPVFLKEIEMMLFDKHQVIFQGPPGTGKTYVAQALANCLAGAKDRVTLVQFHPSYAYEDFVRGFRPALVNGQAGFTLQDGPLLRAAGEARAEAEMDPDAKHFLIIDEINRGNLAKVFGELYFLLEYRDEKISLQYQRTAGETFSLPENLYIIGTMNTADRSIALVDLALRRRFYFIEFHPEKDPVKSVLGRWLDKKAPDMQWVSKVVEEANKLLEEDKHAAIGPSYFMKDRLDEKIVGRIWKHSVLPYIEERLFGIDKGLDAFDLDTLKEKAIQALKQEENERQVDGTEGDGASDNA